MDKRCPVCEKGKLVYVNDIISDINGYIFVESGERCEQCGEEFVDEKSSQRIIETARKLGVWPEPLRLVRTLSTSGGTLVLRIPVDIERQLALRAGEEVFVTKVGHKIVVEPGE